MYTKYFNLRNVAIIACLAAMTMFSGCNPDEDEPDKSDSVVGVWAFENSAATEVEVADGLPQETVDYINAELNEESAEAYWGTNWDFRSDGKAILSQDGETGFEADYTVEGNKLTVSYNEEAITGQYSISGSKLYWDVDMREEIFTDQELTEYGITKAIVRLTFNKK